MATARELLADLLTQGLASVGATPMPTVVGYGKSMDITKRTVMVVPQGASYGPVRGARTYTFQVFAITGPSSLPTAQVEADLDDLMDDVCDALESSVIPNNVTWSTAQRATFEDKAPAYVIDVTCVFDLTPTA